MSRAWLKPAKTKRQKAKMLKTDILMSRIEAEMSKTWLTN